MLNTILYLTKSAQHIFPVYNDYQVKEAARSIAGNVGIEIQGRSFCFSKLQYNDTIYISKIIISEDFI